MIDINHMTFEVFLVSFLTNDVTKEIPIFLPKLLTPHLRYTLEINCRGRTQLISPDGILKQVQPPPPQKKGVHGFPHIQYKYSSNGFMFRLCPLGETVC